MSTPPSDPGRGPRPPEADPGSHEFDTEDKDAPERPASRRLHRVGHSIVRRVGSHRSRETHSEEGEEFFDEFGRYRGEPELEEPLPPEPEAEPPPEEAAPETEADWPAGLPPELLEEAKTERIKPETLVRAKETWPDLDWIDILATIYGARKSEKLARHLKNLHGIDVKQSPIDLSQPVPPEAISKYTLAQIAELEAGEKLPSGERGRPNLPPGTWDTERERRLERDRAIVRQLLNKYSQWIPEDMPLPSNFSIPPWLKIPRPNSGLDKPFVVYGIWRRLLIDCYQERVKKEPGKVKAELKRPGGRFFGSLPITRDIAIRVIASRLLRNEKNEAEIEGVLRDYGFWVWATVNGKNMF